MVKPYNETDFRAINLFIENNWIVDKQIDTTTIKTHIYVYISTDTASKLTHWGRDKWTPFRRRNFQMHFLEWKCLNSD